MSELSLAADREQRRLGYLRETEMPSMNSVSTELGGYTMISLSLEKNQYTLQ